MGGRLEGKRCAGGVFVARPPAPATTRLSGMAELIDELMELFGSVSHSRVGLGGGGGKGEAGSSVTHSAGKIRKGEARETGVVSNGRHGRANRAAPRPTTGPFHTKLPSYF
jgi:hypothetical protein